MNNWNVELAYGISFTVTGVNANTKEEAIAKAREMVEDHATILTHAHVDEGDLEYNACTFCQQSNLI